MIPEYLLNERMELLKSINDLPYAKSTQMKDLKPDEDSFKIADKNGDRLLDEQEIRDFLVHNYLNKWKLRSTLADDVKFQDDFVNQFYQYANKIDPQYEGISQKDLEEFYKQSLKFEEEHRDYKFAEKK